MLIFNNQPVSVDSEGYLQNPQQWNSSIAEQIALQEGITLTDAHWQIIHFVREFYLEYNTSPAIRLLIKAMQQKFPAEQANSRYLYRLFPDGPAKQATKIAGLPKPVRCI